MLKLSRAAALPPPPAGLALAPASAFAVAPDTTIGGPWVTKTTSLTYTFGSPTPGATFQCNLNSGTWRACASPTTVTGVVGQNAFRVRAVLGGEADATPAVK